MNCVFCQLTKISPNVAPYGGFLCASGHIQCMDCNTKYNGRCSVCGSVSDFIRMLRNSQMHGLAAAQTEMALSAVGQAPSAPVLSSSNTTTADERPSKCCHTKSMFDKLEEQSSISKEEMSMQDSNEGDDEETVSKNLHPPDAESHLKNCMASSAIDKEETRNILECNRGEKQNTLHENYYTAQNRKLLTLDSVTLMPSEWMAFPQSAIGDVRDSCVFEENPEEPEVIHTSDICFMNSTESMNNLLDAVSKQTSQARNPNGGGPQLLFPMPSNNTPASHTPEIQRAQVLTQRVLNGVSINASLNNQVVERFFATYGPLATYHIPTYNCQEPHCDFNGNVALASPSMHAISVSTESEPSLRSVQPHTTTTHDVGLGKKFGNPNYVVMHATTVGNHVAPDLMGLDKSGSRSLDMQMQRVLKTFQEDPKILEITEKVEKFKKLSKSLYDDTKSQQPATPMEQHFVKTNQQKDLTKDNDLFTARLVHTYRAKFIPTTHLEPLVHSFKNLSTTCPRFKEPPPPQFEATGCTSSAMQELLSVKANLLYSRPVVTQCMSPSPLQCPESRCPCMIFISDFHKHFATDHSQMPMERITAFQHKNFFIDPRLDRCGISKCHYLYLLRDTITGLGSSRYKDFLPLLVMSSRVSLSQLSDTDDVTWTKMHRSHAEFLIIWITGIVPEEFPISVTLTAWTRSGHMPSCHLVHAGHMYSIRESQKGLDVVHSGHMLMLSASEVDRLTKGGAEMINFQLAVH